MLLNQLLAFGLLNSSLPYLVDLYEERYRLEDRLKAYPDEPQNLNLPTKETFDFIVVGGGTAGCIVARRLADENYSVLLLEAGGDPPPIEAVPSLSQALKRIPSIHYLYTSVPQKMAGLQNGGIVPSSAGKMLGGSASHNTQQYERGSPHDYDSWSVESEEDSWRYEHLMKHFLKAENYEGRWPVGDGQHAKGGMLNVESPAVTFQDDIWFSAATEMGYTVQDSNGPQKVGFSPADYAWKKGRRDSPYESYIKPVEGILDNLTVRRYSVVSEIVFDGKKAVGVLYKRHGVPSVSFAKNEVILSTGAYLSPIILINSGIGPADQVAAAKKELLVELPVGQYMEDHVVAQMPRILVDDQSVFKYPQIEFEHFDEFLATGQGPLSFDSMHEAYLVSSRALEHGTADWADLQLYLRQNPDHKFKNSFVCDVNLNREQSKGTITFNGDAQTEEERLMPIIDYNYFSDLSDLEMMLEGMEFCRLIVENTTSFQNVGGKFDSEALPPCKDLLLGSSNGQVPPNVPIYLEKEYWKCYLTQLATTNNHVTSTVRMGHTSDPTAVVDPKLRVMGVEGLRVIDASIFPHVTNANIVAAVIVVAEKGADDILNQHRGR